MAEIYPLGQNRIFYRTRSLLKPEKVTADLLDPDLNNDTERDLFEVPTVSGLYYFDPVFSKEGTYIAIFYEDGEEKISQAFSTRKIPTEGPLRFPGSSRLINRG